ncbi:hypothetical protein FHS18_006664 [Paenibacillus phyllosphaerae]|uniref:ABC transporter permease n=1 Tax=Paenibacillus phyllosphaerae TaxID=274593 RepID=A0A7W5B528_9BACL|nr:hypothetical protein [Paenibacillus phyllosphaerae]MBB3114543.1 hypothetical protein [Paenibacillus phyllosphaerae]
MSSWQGALVLFRHEMRRSWVGIVVTMAFFTYIAFALMLVMGETIGEQASGETSNEAWFIDFMFLTLLPNIAFTMNRTAFKYWSTNPFTRKLAYWRTMPISLDSIVMARMLQLVVTLALVGIYYFAIQYAMVGELRDILTIGQYVLFILPWMGYALLVSSLYMFAEQTVNGKIYMVICILCIVLYALLVLGLWWIDLQPVSLTLQWAKEGNGLPAIVMLMAGAAVLLAAGHVVRNKLLKRSLINA